MKKFVLLKPYVLDSLENDSVLTNSSVSPSVLTFQLFEQVSLEDIPGVGNFSLFENFDISMINLSSMIYFKEKKANNLKVNYLL